MLATRAGSALAVGGVAVDTDRTGGSRPLSRPRVRKRCPGTRLYVLSPRRIRRLMRVLHIDASARRAGSVTRSLSRYFVERLQARGELSIDYLDLAADPPPPVTEAFTRATSKPADRQTPADRAHLATSERLVGQLLRADAIVVGVPMYNLSVPAVFKAWIDQIVRDRRTFRVTDDGGFEGLVSGLRGLVVTSRGGDFQVSAPLAALDHQTPWLRDVFAFIGLRDLSFVHLDGMSMADSEARLVEAREALDVFAEAWIPGP